MLRQSLRTQFWSFVFVVLALSLCACGGASAQAEASHAYGGNAPATAADRDYDGVADEADNMPMADTAGSGELMMESKAAPPPPAIGGVAQATPAAPPAPEPPADRAEGPPRESPDVPTTPGQQPKPKQTAPGADPAAIATPMLIYTARVTLAVFETQKAIDAVESLAKKSGGYLVERSDRSITIRVPADAFDGSLKSVQKVGDLLDKNVSVQDVTEEFVDLSIRIRNLEVVRKRLELLLDRANKVPDAIAVERELSRVTQELERYKGRLKLIKELVRFSTITVEFRAQASEHVSPKVQLPFPWLNNLGLGNLLRL